MVGDGLQAIVVHHFFYALPQYSSCFPYMITTFVYKLQKSFILRSFTVIFIVFTVDTHDVLPHQIANGH